MNNTEFVKGVPAETLAVIFKDFFDQHMFAYAMMKDIEFAGINSINYDKASIMYSIRLLDDEDKEKLLENLNSSVSSLIIYGKQYDPEIYLNGDLLCITIKK